MVFLGSFGSLFYGLFQGWLTRAVLIQLSHDALLLKVGHLAPAPAIVPALSPPQPRSSVPAIPQRESAKRGYNVVESGYNVAEYGYNVPDNAHQRPDLLQKDLAVVLLVKLLELRLQLLVHTRSLA